MSKNFLIGMCLVVLSIYGCNDDDSEPESSINIEDLQGTWVSVDSLIGRLPDGSYSSYHDFLEVRNDSIILNEPRKFINPKGYSVYTYHLLPYDSINLHYEGPWEVGIINNNWHHQVTIKGDTLFLLDFSKTYPYSHFNSYIKL